MPSLPNQPPPDEATPGSPGTSCRLLLELKLLADVGFVVGKELHPSEVAPSGPMLGSWWVRIPRKGYKIGSLGIGTVRVAWGPATGEAPHAVSCQVVV